MCFLLESNKILLQQLVKCTYMQFLGFFVLFVQKIVKPPWKKMHAFLHLYREPLNNNPCYSSFIFVQFMCTIMCCCNDKHKVKIIKIVQIILLFVCMKQFIISTLKAYWMHYDSWNRYFFCIHDLSSYQNKRFMDKQI